MPNRASSRIAPGRGGVPEATDGAALGSVTSVSFSGEHTFSKTGRPSIRLVAGSGVEGDAHAGEKVRHRSRVARDPNQPNLRQVHLVHDELFAELRSAGFEVKPGDIGENFTTHGVALLSLPTGSRLRLGHEAVIQITGLRNPCVQLDRLLPGLMSAVLDRDDTGHLIRKAGVMSIVLKGGEIRPGDPVAIELPPPPHRPLVPV
jgi:MOSC domain-containing protein YiiM